MTTYSRSVRAVAAFVVCGLGRERRPTIAIDYRLLTVSNQRGSPWAEPNRG
jgi:hypothetical protein